MMKTAGMNVAFFLLIFVTIFPRSSCELPPTASTRHLNDLRNRMKYAGTPQSFGQGGDDDVSHSNNMISIQCSKTPLFFCSDNKTACGERIRQEQDSVIHEVQSMYPGAKVIATTHKLVNAIFMELPSNGTTIPPAPQRSAGKNKNTLKRIAGVKRILPHTSFQPQLQDSVDYIGVNNDIQTNYCATGKGVKVAVLDTGVDYTHEALDGFGTVRAYRRAFGRNESSIENTRRDGMFPTRRVVEGYDFLGDLFDETLQAMPDDDPIDYDGHGTNVASTIVAVAPDVELVAVKVCSVTHGCPQFSILQGFEYALDPNGDNSTDDKVDIINFSLTSMTYLPYYDMISLAVEEAFRLGVLSVVAGGNLENKPYILTSVSQTPNALSCAATAHPVSDKVGVIAHYSSRGPGQNNIIKPDLAAPSGSNGAFVGSGNKYKRRAGTSFSTPLIAGASALIKSTCPTCSPFAIKAILMNNAYRGIKTASGDIAVPVTLGGSGELRIDDALEATFWAFSPDEGDVQPSISLGLVNAAADVTIQRTVKVVGLTSYTQTLTVMSKVRDPSDEASGAVRIVISPNEAVLTSCPGEALINVEFRVTAANAPNNKMNSGGSLGSDPVSLDKNEFDGHILISSKEAGKEIGLPFHLLIRKAANVSVSNKTLPSSIVASSTVIEVENQGAAVGQVDTFELLVLSQDDPESPQGEDDVPSDLRAVGYRTLDVGEPYCSFLLEFAFTLWERPLHIVPHYVFATISVDDTDYVLYNNGIPHRKIECKILNAQTNATICTGFPVDHATNTGNIVLRACAEHFGITEARSILVQFHASAVPSRVETFTDSTDVVEIRVPGQSISADSFNIRPGEAQRSLTVKQESTLVSGNHESLGLQLITNAYRSVHSTGAATSDTEVLFVLKEDVTPPFERTPDTVTFPAAADMTGPLCQWREDACSLLPSAAPTYTASPTTTPRPTWSPTMTAEPTSERTPPPQEVRTPEPSCPPNAVPRAQFPTTSPWPTAETSSASLCGCSPTFLILLLAASILWQPTS